MPTQTLTLHESDIVKMMLEFLENRDLCISMLSLERETGQINGLHGEDMLFLRQLVLDGQWDDVLDFIQPLAGMLDVDMKRIRYLILKHKFLELLCIKAEGSAALPGGNADNLLALDGTGDFTVDQVLACLSTLEPECPSKEDYSGLCFLLTLPKLDQHPDYQNWNPSLGRVQCFKQMFPLVEPFLRLDNRGRDEPQAAMRDRLLQLIVKGQLYEACVDFCQSRATDQQADLRIPPLLENAELSEVDLSLLSWIQCLPADTFACPFEQRALAMDLRPLNKPSLEASWAEHILVQPIKPKMFPYSHMRRPKSADLLSRSLISAFDGLSHGLGRDRPTQDQKRRHEINLMSQSMAGFHLARPTTADAKFSSRQPNPMQRSVDRLFSSGAQLSQSITDRSGVGAMLASSMRVIQEEQSTEASLSPKNSQGDLAGDNKESCDSGVEYKRLSNDTSGDLFREYQRRQAIADDLEMKEKQRLDLQRDLERHLDTQSGLNKSASSSSDSQQTTPRAAPPTPNNQINNPARPGQPPVLTTSQRPLQKSDVASPAANRASSRPSSSTFAPPTPSSLDPLKTQANTSTPGSQRRSQQNVSEAVSSPAVRRSQPQAPFSQSNGSAVAAGATPGSGTNRFIPVTSLEDTQAIRTVAFHPRGHLYTVGSNSKVLRVCQFPDLTDINNMSDSICDGNGGWENHTPTPPNIVFKKAKQHKGSIYCVAWSPTGEVIATGSNDKTVRLVTVDPNTGQQNLSVPDSELTHHDGTVRDVIFMQDNNAPLLVSGGAGDCRVYIADCLSNTVIRAFPGHTGHIYTLHSWTATLLVSGSADKTARLWDLRMAAPVQIVPSYRGEGSDGSAFASVSVDPTGRLMASGHEDATISLYDIRGARYINAYRPHTSDVRSVRFSGNAFYLLSGSYDNKIILTDLHGDLLQALPHVTIADHSDKVIQCRWHPQQLAFVSTSADKTATCWCLPPT